MKRFQIEFKLYFEVCECIGSRIYKKNLDSSTHIEHLIITCQILYNNKIENIPWQWQFNQINHHCINSNLSSTFWNWRILLCLSINTITNKHYHMTITPGLICKKNGAWWVSHVYWTKWPSSYFLPYEDFASAKRRARSGSRIFKSGTLSSGIIYIYI